MGASRAKKNEFKGEVVREGNSEVKFLGRTIGMGGLGLAVLQWGLFSSGSSRALRGEQGGYAGSRGNHVPQECRPSEQPCPGPPGHCGWCKLPGPQHGTSEGGRIGANEARHKKAHPRCRLTFAYQEVPNQVTVSSGSGWEGDQATPLERWSCMVLTSCFSRAENGEADPNAQVMETTECLGVTSLCEEWHLSSELACFCDSSVARRIASVVGVGKNETH